MAYESSRSRFGTDSVRKGALHFSKESPVIQGKIQMQWFNSVEIFQKKGNT